MKSIYLYLILFLLSSSTSSLLEDEKCCLKCEKENEEKYYSIDYIFGKCGECCLDPKDYWKYKIFELGLTKADNVTCESLGYGVYDKTETHGVMSLKVTLDLYDKTPLSKCCDKCEKENEVKYYSIDWIFGKCGECCLDPKDYWKYKIFEPGLTKAETESGVCASLGYAKYDKTETHGALSLKVTLDLYNKGNDTNSQ